VALCGEALASARAKRDDASGRRSYEAFIEGRALECGSKRTREPLEQAWRKIRRGWYLGEFSFKDRLLDVLGQTKTRPKTSSVGGGAVESEREAAVEAWIVDDLKALKLSEEDLSRLAKGADTKLALAWRLRRETTLSREWIAQRLHMGHVTRVTQAWREVEGAKQGALLKLRRQGVSILLHEAEEVASIESVAGKAFDDVGALVGFKLSIVVIDVEVPVAC
jgi:putative transposase